MTIEEFARQRIAGDADLKPFADVLLQPIHPGHYDWVAFADRLELLTWAKTIEAAQKGSVEGVDLLEG
jgi:hypothetical protein